MVSKIVPLEIKYNPYTGKPSEKLIHNFQSGGSLNGKILKDWLLEDMPDYSIKIRKRNIEDFYEYVKDPRERDINKVILFTSKETITPHFKAITAEFREGIRFYVVQLVETPLPADL